MQRAWREAPVAELTCVHVSGHRLASQVQVEDLLPSLDVRQRDGNLRRGKAQRAWQRERHGGAQWGMRHMEGHMCGRQMVRSSSARARRAAGRRTEPAGDLSPAPEHTCLAVKAPGPCERRVQQLWQICGGHDNLEGRQCAKQGGVAQQREACLTERQLDGYGTRVSSRCSHG